ncbi:MAG: type II secretion system minor pseudopilin GspK [Gammaproteobacteria bacterium]
MIRVRERGVAILIALVIIAIASAIAGRMIWDRNLALHRTQNILRFEQDYLYATGAESWIASLIHEDLGTQPTVNLTQNWAEELPPLPIPHGEMAGRLVDLQGYFNLNNLAAQTGGVNVNELAVFERLLAEFDINPEVAQAVANWVSSTQSNSGSGSNGIYASLTPPYRAPNAPMASATELRLVAGIDRSQYEALRPWMVSLPIPTALNINTAPLPILESLTANPNASNLQNIVKQQRAGGFQSTALFESMLGQPVTIPVGVDSSFFRLLLSIHYAGSRFTLRSILFRAPTGQTRVYSQSFGNSP